MDNDSNPAETYFRSFRKIKQWSEENVPHGESVYFATISFIVIISVFLFIANIIDFAITGPLPTWIYTCLYVLALFGAYTGWKYGEI